MKDDQIIREKWVKIPLHVAEPTKLQRQVRKALLESIEATKTSSHFNQVIVGYKPK